MEGHERRMTQNDTDRQLTAEAVGELRERLRAQGWSSDLGWTMVGSRSALAVAADGEARRTVAYLASLRAIDGGASGVWKDGDVPAPPEADAREVLTARPGDSDWHSELLEAPVENVASGDDTTDESPADDGEATAHVV